MDDVHVDARGLIDFTREADDHSGGRLPNGLGVGLGVLFGCLIGYYAGDVAAFLERVFRFEIFDSSVYIVTRLPSELQAGQVLWISAVAMAITLLSTIYPAYRASRERIRW